MKIHSQSRPHSHNTARPSTCGYAIDTSLRLLFQNLALEVTLFGMIAGLLLFSAEGETSWILVQVLVSSIFAAVAMSVFFQWASSQQWVVWNSRNIILAGVLFWLLLDPLQMREGIEEFPSSVVLLALFYAVIFMAAISVGYFIPPYRGLARIFSQIDEPSNRGRVFGTLLVISLIGFSPLVVTTGASVETFTGVLFAGYSETTTLGWRREALGDARGALIAVLQFFLLVLPFLGTWALRQVRLLWWQKLSIGAITTIVLTVVFFSGARRLFAFVVLGPLLYLYGASALKARRWRFFAFPAVAVVLLFLMQTQMQFRAAGFYEVDLTTLEGNLTLLHRDNNFYWLAMAVDTMPQVYPFTGEWPFFSLLYHPIPRFLWPGKPVSEGFPFVSWSEQGSTLSVSAVGDLYIAQGLLGIILGGLMYGWIGRNWDQLRLLASGGNIVSMIYCMGLVLLLLGVRGFNEITVHYYAVGLLVLIAFYLSKRSKRKHSAVR